MLMVTFLAFPTLGVVQLSVRPFKPLQHLTPQLATMSFQASLRPFNQALSILSRCVFIRLRGLANS